jgi:hypothetical protein
MSDFDEEIEERESDHAVQHAFRVPMAYITRGQLSIVDEGIWHARSELILSVAELADSSRCMEVLGWRQIEIPEFLYLLDIARRAFNRGPRDRTKTMMVRLHQPRRALARVPESNCAFQNVVVTELRQFLTPEDCEALLLIYGTWERQEDRRQVVVTHDLISSQIEDDEGELRTVEDKREALALLKNAVPKDLLEGAVDQGAQYWCDSTGLSALSVDQIETLRDHLRTYAPCAVRTAMDKAINAYRSRSSPEKFERIISFLVIAEQMVEDKEAENIHKLKGAVYDGYGFLAERQALILLRIASSLGISLNRFKRQPKGGGRDIVYADEIRRAIGDASPSAGELRVPPASSGVWR